MKSKSIILILFLSLACLPNLLLAKDNDSHPIVPGFERFINVEDITDVERGMLLLHELNCSSCHTTNSAWSANSKRAPILTEIGKRVMPEYLEPFLTDPHTVKPGTTMPNVLAGMPKNQRQEVAESIAHFLASTATLAEQPISYRGVAQGEKLFHSVGCVACHDPQNSGATIATSIPLGKLETKYTLPGLTDFIKNPMHVRPSGRMPQFNLTDQEINDIATYLLRENATGSAINFAYYEGSWEKLPEFRQLKPKSTGVANGFDIYVGAKKDNYGVVFTGFWETKTDAEYQFRISSDDGSRVLVDGKSVIDNDGLHGMGWKQSKAKIPTGIHEVRVEFFEKTSGEGLQIEVSGGGLAAVGFESLVRATRAEPETAEDDVFKLDLAKAAIGKTHFQSVGCANCHELKLNNQLLSPLLADAKPFALDPNGNVSGGCLAGAADSPDFGLSNDQVNCLKAAIANLNSPNSQPASAEQLVHEKFTSLNCYACHNRQMSDRSIRGGVVDVRGDSEEIYGRKDWFTGTQVEMGDEGQHPPALTSIGSKLNPQWFATVLTEGIKDRPYMLTQMPMFGTDNLGTLSQELIELDALTDVKQVVQTEVARKVKSHGRFFAGDDALSCIKCHTFGKYQATGIQAIDLTTMTKRLNKDWFQAYMLKPSRFRRGTRMPESWPNGKSYYPDILEGDTSKQIDAVWAFLSDGEEAAKPKGLVRAKMELKAVDAPKIYRNFIEGAGPRAIGVGYPELVNLAFDAELCRLALIWQENFIDASRHWTGRGQGFEGPLGENVLKLPEAITFSKSLNPKSWDKSNLENRPKFKGYRFDENRRPTFIYQIDDVTIEDQPLPHIVDGQLWLKRKFKITSKTTKQLHYLIARGDLIQIDGRSITIDGRWTTRFSQESMAEANNAKNGVVIVTIDLSSGTAELEQTYEW
ncbi:MAG: cytochrome c553 [Mariniblastus sp.]|jgi:cytochrome c553